MNKNSPKNKGPLIVGLTGGIGSGKSTVAKIFGAMGIGVFNSDVVAKNILDQDESVRTGIISLLGQVSYNGSKANRPYIASKIFSNDQLRAKLNAIVHPAVGDNFENWIGNNESSSFLIKESAILFETGIYKDLDRNILVSAPVDIRIDRVISRDNTSKEDVQSRINSQWTDDQKRSLTDYDILNDGIEPIIPQVLKIYSELTSDQI